ncbi:MAG: DNA polymerase III subunit beta [Thermodesulfovibrionales bacterium]|nr:DNA polymerase III subunit beta [Thermodesulfovibrionales bacterium]
MKVRIKKEELLKKLNRIQYIVEKKSTVAVLSYFLLKAKSDESFIIATDLETGIKMPIQLEIDEEGECCLPGKKLFEITKEVESDINIETSEDGWAKIKSGKTNFRLGSVSVHDFPVFPKVDFKKRITISKADLLDAIDKTIYAVGEADTKYMLNSILFHIKSDNTLTLVGTDGHRLTIETKNVVSQGLEDETRLIISKKSIYEIRRNVTGEGDIDIWIEKNYILLKTEDMELLCRLVEGNYPIYENAVPSMNEIILTVKKELLEKSLKKAIIISTEKYSTVIFDIDKELMTVSASNPEVGEVRDEVTVNFEHEPMRIAFSARLLLESLNAMDSEKIFIKMKDHQSAVLVIPDSEDNYKCVLMPIRL